VTRLFSAHERRAAEQLFVIPESEVAAEAMVRIVRAMLGKHSAQSGPQISHAMLMARVH
jgi:hypothetical protein